MTSYREQVEAGVDYLRARLTHPPETIIILGTGLGGLGQRVEEAQTFPYAEIPHFPLPAVPSHAGQLVCGRIGGRPVAVLQGRVHLYEGYSSQAVTLPLRVLSLLGGARQLLIANAAGGLNPAFPAGSLMLIADHLNFMNDNPLRGVNIEPWGPRFPDLSQAYDRELLATAEDCARGLGLKNVSRGVYAAIPGPSLETPAETRYLRQCGADAVGMSTVPEVIVARHAGLAVLAISVIANCNDPDHPEPVIIEEVIRQAEIAAVELERLLLALLGGR